MYPDSMIDFEKMSYLNNELPTPREIAVNKVKPSDTDILKNDKVMLMIFLYLHPTKDSLYFFLVRLNKSVGVRILQQHYEAMDLYLPLKHNEIIDVQ